MKTLRTFLGIGRGASRFDRYYAGVLRAGIGYPTADEARRDLRHYDLANQTMSWIR